MKKLLMITLLAVVEVALAQSQPPAPTTGVSQEQRERKRKKVTPEAQMKSFGGFVTAEYKGNYCYFMNAQVRVNNAVFETVADQIQKVLSIPVRTEKCEITGGDNFAPIRIAWSGGRQTGAVVSIVDVPGWSSILVAPEDGWAQVNIAALAKDSPTDEVLETRTRKELWRAFVILLGGGNAHLAGDLMRPINSLKDLDAYPNLVPGPEPFNTVVDSARVRGITQIRRATYKQACVEGWAPAPTNDFQKAIFEQIKAEKDVKPSNPIKVIYDPKKAK